MNEPQPKCWCGRKAYLVDPLFPYQCELNRCWYHRGGTKWHGREKEYQREYRKANRDRINELQRSNPKTRERNKIYRKANRARFNAHNRKYRAAHKDELRERYRGRYKRKYKPEVAAEWRKKNSEKLKARDREFGARQRAELADNYVRRVLATGLRVPAAALPAEAIELNRAIIKLKRQLYGTTKRHR